MSSRVPREPVWHVQQFDLMQSVGMDRMMQFEPAFSHAPCAPKTRRETIFLPEDASDKLFLVKYGRVVLGQRGRDGREVLFDVVNPGEIFGEMAVLGQRERRSFARALERSMVCSLPSDTAMEMIGDSALLLSALTAVVGEREQRLESRLRDMVFKDAAGRLATVLHRLAQDAGVKEAGGIRLDVRLSQEEYGALIGTTRETVSQVLGKLTDAGLIVRDGRTIRVVDVDGLGAVAEVELAR